MKRIISSIYLLLSPFVPALFAQQSAEEIDPQELIVPQVSSNQGHSIIRKEYPTLESVIKLQDSLANSRGAELPARSNRDISLYAVGSIPIQESVSPSGARVYNIPITTAQGYNLTPNISLVYNSQGGNNVAGYGWSIGGLSSISVRNSTLYYDGEAKGGRYSSTSSKYALGRTTTYSGYNKFGKPTTVTDYRNRSTTYTYDSWGNLVSTTRPDGGVEQTTQAWGGDGLYTLTQTATGSPQTVTYNSFDRPASISENTGVRPSASLIYNADGERVKTVVTTIDGDVRRRYYAGDRYEHDITETVECFYLGGDAYSAPMVMIRPGGGGWILFNIGRDYLGNITDVIQGSGSITRHYRYDPWGRMINPSTGELYSPSNEPSLILGRGYTGHEHLPWFGLINANARLYDPLLGRFLSPDPYVQDPDFTQNFNRYSYCLNNPLKYTDESGEIIQFLIGGIIGGYINWIANGSDFSWRGVGYFAVGALMGALTAGASVLTATALATVSGVAAGALAGGIVGAATGGLSGLTTNGLNNLVAGNSFMDNAENSFLSGMLTGAIGGAIGGGFTGGRNAYESGKNVWWGNEVKYGRNQWSINPAEKPFETIKFKVNGTTIVNNNDCFPNVLKEINDFYNGGKTYEDFCDYLGYKQDVGTTTTPRKALQALKDLFNANEIDISTLYDSLTTKTLQRQNSVITVLMRHNNTLSHIDNIRAIDYYSTKTIVRLGIGRYSLSDLIKRYYWSVAINGLKY